jgi:tetratricopeptide (TPR) repeat protein
MSCLKKIAIVITLFSCLNGVSQNMNEGFQLLETGKFEKAENYFQKVLVNYPNNKTANLCYGRAVGLNGKPALAVEIFSKLLIEYKGDLEIQLNYAESLLWNKQFEKAKKFYLELVDSYPTNFSALLGMANTFSNLKDFKNALLYVNKALHVSPKNVNALISKKYIHLGYANQYVQEQNYAVALTLLNENLIDFPNDKESFLNKATIYLITEETKKAKSVYQLIATNLKDSIIALNGLSLVAHIDEKDKEALNISEKAIEKVKIINDSLLTKKTIERYIQALIWNKKYKMAASNITTYSTIYSLENWLLGLRATLGMYKGDFKQSIIDYANILKTDSLSFDGNLGIANAFFANGETKQAYKSVFKTLEIYKNQKDAIGFLKKVNGYYTPFIEEKLGYSFDNGKNRAYSSNTEINFPASTKLSFLVNYQYRNTNNTTTNNEATTNNLKLGFQYKLHPKISFNAKVGVSAVKSFSNNYSQLLAETFFKIKPVKLQDLEIGYKRDLQNFNADLVDKEIISNNYYLNYNIASNLKFGWFTQYYYTSQSDDNTRNLFFTSLYYNFLSKPVFKGGINYQFISFKNQVPTTYFSPEKFNAVEIFINLLKDEKSTEANSWFYSLNAATGFQYIENLKRQSTYRFQAKIGYKSSDRMLASIYAVKSNIASATAVGFTYTEVGFRLKWYLTKKPVFKLQ